VATRYSVPGTNGATDALVAGRAAGRAETGPEEGGALSMDWEPRVFPRK